MPKTVKIRDIDDEVCAALVRRAAQDGITVAELLRREVTRLAMRPSMSQWLAREGDGRQRSQTLRCCRRSTSGAVSGRVLVVDVRRVVRRLRHFRANEIADRLNRGH